MRTYDTYKDSGISWLGQIPSHWESRKFKFTFNERKQKGFPDEPLLAATQSHGVIPKDLYETRTMVATKGLETLKLVEKGDFVISLRSFQGGIEYAYYRGIISPAYTVLTPTAISAKYFKYLGKCQSFIALLKSSVTGIREGQNIDYSKLRDNLLPLPPVNEQDTIAEYLDSATAEIDKAIASQQRMVELLQERKQIIINQAVTQGLNPDAPMKPTNINYIGNVPAHWQITQFKRGISKLTDYTANGSFGDLARNVQYLDYPEYSRLIRLTDLRENLKNDKCVWVNKRSHDYLSKSELFGGELLIANVGAYSGYSCIMPKTNLKCTLGPNMELIECNQLLLNEYASLVLNSKSFFNHLQMVAISSAQPKLNKNDIKSIFFLFPPIKEQEEIIEYIKITTKPIDAEITRCEQKIALLTERKQILINDVVTGKIKVA